jgi:glycosyltransferase involved in cell wall biosynthesis
MGQPVIINWPLSSYTGWGLYALNLALSWSYDPEIQALCSHGIEPDRLAVDPLRNRVLLPFFARSTQFIETLQKVAGRVATVNIPIVHALGNQLLAAKAAHNVALQGTPSIGIFVFEHPLQKETVERGKRLSIIITGSTWNERLLRAYGIKNVRTVLQGIDPSHFHPGPKLGLFPGRFLIFSGGKAELRKAQDIVLAAFKLFATRHPEAMLVTAWHSPWPQFATGLNSSRIAAPVVFKQTAQLDVLGWAEANGIRADQVLDLGSVPNASMPAVLREMDVAVFPNRAEGGTNLVAMECMACGLPVILSRNTGHLDLIADDNCYTLHDQRQVPGFWTGVGDVSGWGESQVDEVVEQLEAVFTDKAEAARCGARAAETVGQLTWAAHSKAMKDVILSSCVSS